MPDLIIGYLAQKFPQLTMTFVYREVLALRAAGLHVETFSIWKPRPGDLSEESKGLVAGTFYVFPLNLIQFCLNHLSYLITRPGRYLGTLWFCLTRAHTSFKNRWRTFLHFLQAVRLAKEVERRKVDHMHVHFALNATTLALVVSRLTGVTFSFTAHANDIFVNPILLPEKIKAARFVVAISQFNARFLEEIAPGPQTTGKIHVVHCGIDLRQYAPRPRGAATDRPVILAVGRLVEKKGYPYLIDACKTLADAGRDFQCVIVGGGPQQASLQQLIDQRGLSGRVKLAGAIFQERIREYFERADVFVLPCVVGRDQDMDGIPNTLMEAMALELPVISTSLSGIPELIEDGRTGVLVPPQDAVSLARAIARLLDEPELRSALGRAGRAKVMLDFEIERNAHVLLDIFESKLTRDSAGQRHTQELSYS